MHLHIYQSEDQGLKKSLNRKRHQFLQTSGVVLSDAMNGKLRID